jgi:hypothetical protein
MTIQVFHFIFNLQLIYPNIFGGDKLTNQNGTYPKKNLIEFDSGLEKIV